MDQYPSNRCSKHRVLYDEFHIKQYLNSDCKFLSFKHTFYRINTVRWSLDESTFPFRYRKNNMFDPIAEMFALLGFLCKYLLVFPCTSVLHLSSKLVGRQTLVTSPKCYFLEGADHITFYL